MVPIDESSKRASNKYHGDDAQPTTSKRCNQQHFSHPYKRCGVNQYSPNILNKRVRFKTKDLFESSKSRPPFQRDLKGNTGCVILIT
jgi:hypothetical protein